MRIAFFGEDAFSLVVLDSLVKDGHSIVGVYCPIYDNLIYKRLNVYCDNNKINFNRLNDFKHADFLDSIINLELDLIVVCHFQKLLPNELISIPQKGSINLHPSLLPLYRGMSPQHWPIINGEIETGITVHFIDEGIDTGDIIIQKKLPIRNDVYVFELQNEMKKVYATIVRDAVDQIQKNELKVIKQSHLSGSYYGKLKLNQCTLDKGMKLVDAYNLIRGVSFPYFGARFDNYIIWKATMVDIDKSPASDLNFKMDGIIIHETGSYIYFKNGLLKLEKWEKHEK